MINILHSGHKFLVILVIGVLAIVGILLYFVYSDGEKSMSIDNFEECVAAGNPVMTSYPRQCRTEDGQSFSEFVGNELEKSDLIRISSPRPNDDVGNPIQIEGEARGYWFFEASFPVLVTDWNGQIIGEGYATAGSSWMTESFVPFTATVSYDKSMIQGNYSNKGTLILQKANASGLPEHDDALEIPIVFR